MQFAARTDPQGLLDDPAADPAAAPTDFDNPTGYFSVLDGQMACVAKTEKTISARLLA